MATSFGAASASAASMTENARKTSQCLPAFRRRCFHRSSPSKVSFCVSQKPKIRLSSKGLQSGWNSSRAVRAQMNKVALDGSSKDTSSSPTKSEVSSVEAKDAKLLNKTPTISLASEDSISEFINQVSSLVKLVDSKDIVELQLNQLDCEILIRKKQALPLPPSTPVPYVQSSPQPAAILSTPIPSPVPTGAPPPLISSPSPSKAQLPKSSHPPLKCPMAGTLYRSPAPGEPPFVKVGDKVQKGQVLCIIEAMKLMNEIEADQSGTIVDILVEDGKPVSVDTPLFVIEP